MIDTDETIILVDENDRERGTVGKIEGHREGLLHRAFSVVVDDGRGRLLLQKRAVGKYHSGGLWTNTCCSHPRRGESVLEAAHRRLVEEMGFDCPLRPVLSTIYRAELDNDMIEHELVHVLAGRHAGPIRPAPEEADGFAWVTRDEVRRSIEAEGERYSYWFKKFVREYWDEITASVMDAA